MIHRSTSADQSITLQRARDTQEHIRRAINYTAYMAPIAVLGGSGGVAQEAVRQLLAADREVRAVGRSKERLQKLFEPSDNLSIVEASVGLPESLKTALAGTSGVINAVSGKGYWSPAAVDFQVGLAAGAAMCGCERNCRTSHMGLKPAPACIIAGTKLSALQGVLLQGSGNVAEAAKEAGAEHVVLVSSALVTKKNR